MIAPCGRVIAQPVVSVTTETSVALWWAGTVKRTGFKRATHLLVVVTPHEYARSYFVAGEGWLVDSAVHW